eukprot:TRINITY_DN1931_c2_g1_i2.p1 TRINITY_DN1931_c2_g1~~TRINITY_DN1931_c2_g1_i2.p1  ORF type:complete len:214 (-),score=13.36 TRINITY_DN1931_c2_g1_i2:186-827(-)
MKRRRSKSMPTFNLKKSNFSTDCQNDPSNNEDYDYDYDNHDNGDVEEKRKNGFYELIEVFDHSQKKELLKNYLSEQYCSELYYFIYEVEEYKKRFKIQNKKNLNVNIAKNIFENFISVEAKTQINVKMQTIEDIQDQLDTPTMDLFDKPRTDVLLEIYLIHYPRFKDSEELIRYEMKENKKKKKKKPIINAGKYLFKTFVGSIDEDRELGLII